MVGNGRILRSRDLADALRKEHSGSDEIRISEEDRILLDFMSSHNMRIDGPGDWRPIVRDIMHKYGVENDTMMEKRHALAESLRNQIDGETDFEVHDDPIEDDDAAIVLQVPKGRVEPWWFTHSQVPIINIEDTAFPTSFRGTCGCCASGTVMNMAGFNFSERDVVSYASNNGLCSTGGADPADNGGTTAMDRPAIIEGMSGIQCTNTTGLYTLEELATQVETGHGVILGVDASGLPGYNCAPGSGHAIVLASVVRNSSTNKIDGYYIYDSNGRVNDTSGNDYDVCQFVPAETLDMCFESWGRRSNVSLQVIR